MAFRALKFVRITYPGAGVWDPYRPFLHYAGIVYDDGLVMTVKVQNYALGEREPLDPELVTMASLVGRRAIFEPIPIGEGSRGGITNLASVIFANQGVAACAVTVDNFGTPQPPYPAIATPTHVYYRQPPSPLPPSATGSPISALVGSSEAILPRRGKIKYAWG
jgi:hypothetical protein